MLSSLAVMSAVRLSMDLYRGMILRASTSANWACRCSLSALKMLHAPQETSQSWFVYSHSWFMTTVVTELLRLLHWPSAPCLQSDCCSDKESLAGVLLHMIELAVAEDLDMVAKVRVLRLQSWACNHYHQQTKCSLGHLKNLLVSCLSPLREGHANFCIIPRYTEVTEVVASWPKLAAHTHLLSTAWQKGLMSAAMQMLLC